LQGFQHLEVSRDKLKNEDIPALEQQIKEQENTIPALSEAAEQVDIDHFFSYIRSECRSSGSGTPERRESGAARCIVTQATGNNHIEDP
jgi:hypothetical protein